MTDARTIFFVATVCLLSACGIIGKKDATLKVSSGEQKFSSGVKSYEDGDYRTSLEELQAALDMGLNSKGDQVAAYKYLAFIHCISGREKQCRDNFKKAVEIDPNFDLMPAEAGHPVWGPVFRSVKGKPAK